MLEVIVATNAFVGRAAELGRLEGLLANTTDTRRDSPGVAVLLRGRRRVGKSRLVQVFCERAGVPSVFFQASQGAPADSERAAFAAAANQSDLPGRDLFAPGLSTPDWPATLRLLAAALPDDAPSIVVIDELPWLIESDPALEGALQTAWDRLLSRKPVLLVLIGSDLAMMEQLDDYRRPFHQRATVMVLPSLNPAEVGAMLELEPADAIDAYLVSGGLPLICQDWEPGATLTGFLTKSLHDPTSPLLVSGERSLAAEFPASLQARTVLGAIGTGERTWKGIRAAMSPRAGEQMAASSLSKAMSLLERKRVVAIETPLGTVPSRERRYRIADPYLRFYLAFLHEATPLIERGRPDLALSQVQRGWTSWRGRAVEPIIRDALFRIAPSLGWGDVGAVGGWWNRQNNPELDLVGADREPVAKRVIFAGSIKWHETRRFDRHDHTALVRDMAAIPGADDKTELIAVSRAGVDSATPVRSVGPAEILQAWEAAD